MDRKQPVESIQMGDRQLHDIELVSKAKNGDKEALLSLIMARKNEYYKLAYVYTGNKEDAMDAMEDMILILYKDVSKLRDSRAFCNWSKVILANCCRNLVRKRSKVLALQEIEKGTVEEGFARQERKVDILQCLKVLNEKQQEAIKLKYFLDMDYESIARISNVPVGTVKSRIAAGLKKLNDCFGGEY